MKDLQTIINQDSVYLHDWEESKKIGLISDFDQIYITKEEFEANKSPFPNEEMGLKEN